jgi:hypothetical protein
MDRLAARADWPKSSFIPLMFSRKFLPLFFAGLLIASASGRAQSFYAYYQEPVYGYRPAYPAYDDQPAADIISRGSQPTVRGNRAVVRNGVAYAPSNAPDAVKRAIWATNSLRRKPYKWGGGHGSFFDSGYDCSGTVCFALHYAGVLDSPVPSSDLLNFGERGRGRWITIYSRSGHTFAVIAGLRLDTTGDYGTEGPRWHENGRDTWGYEARHPIGM